MATPEVHAAPAVVVEPAPEPAEAGTGTPAAPAAPPGAMSAAEIARHFEKGRALQQQMVDALKARSAESTAFAKAFAQAQADFKPVKRVKEVQVTMRSGGTYTFRYAPLDVILEATLPALNAHGFSLTQRIGKGEHGDFIETTLLHETGERTNRTPIFITDSGAQAYASGVTYARRYGVTLLLCVAAEDDEDGNAADGNDTGSGPRATPAGKNRGGKGAAKQESRVELLPGEQRRTAPTRPAFPAGESGAPAGARDDPDREVAAPTGDKEQVAAEGRIADAIQEFQEAAVEGRKIGIEQIWSEIKADEYVATQTWRRLKEQHPDAFAIVSEVLRPRDRAPRGAKK
jgi:ERF superfamily protein